MVFLLANGNSCFFFLFMESATNSLSLGFVLDKEDKSITRSDLYFKQLFNKCGLHIYKMKVRLNAFLGDYLCCRDTI